jgi:hypothetical protein
MKANHLAVFFSLAAATVATGAQADQALYASITQAQASCGADTVVWVDLDRGRYYKAGTADFAKGNNGVYTCERAAHAKYREGKSEPTAVAKQ